MKTGSLDKRIIIQKYESITNENGFEEPIWNDWVKCWASINNLFGKEFWQAKAVNSESTLEFVIRYSKKVEMLQYDTENYRIHWNNRNFDITFADNVKYQNKFLKIKAIEVK